MPANPPPAPRDTPESVAPMIVNIRSEVRALQAQGARITAVLYEEWADALERYAALLARPAPEARWRVKPLNWWERIEGEEWTACHGDNVYTVLRLEDGTFRASIPQRGGLMVGRTLVLGTFATPEEGRACAQADHEGGVLACLEPDPRPAPEAREAALRAALARIEGFALGMIGSEDRDAPWAGRKMLDYIEEQRRALADAAPEGGRDAAS